MMSDETSESDNGEQPTEEHNRMVPRNELQSTVEELQSRSEELKAPNEEVLSINEGLQSSYEEFETRKEQVQSLSEELRTVNGRSKMEEHLAASSDLSSLLASTNIAVLVLDPCLRQG